MSQRDGTHNTFVGIANNVLQVGTLRGDVVIDNSPSEYRLSRCQWPAKPGVGSLVAQPSQLLDPRLAVVEFTGRDDELRRLAEWRDAGAGPSALWLHGPGGQGKTRLANTFAEICQQAGWTVAEATRRRGRTHDLRPADSAGLLLVVDYADRWPLTQLQNLFDDSLLRHDVPTKLLLLARTRKPWSRVQAALRRRYIDAEIMALPALSGDRTRMFTVARNAFAAHYGLAAPEAITAPDSLRGPDFALTLAIHMAALVAVDSEQRKERPPTDLAGLSAYLLNREHLLWAERFGEEWETDLGRATFIAALTGGLVRDEAQAILGGLGVADVVDRHQDCYPTVDQPHQDHTDPASRRKPRVLEPLRPDRLAEDFLALSLPGHDNPDHEPDDWATTALDTLLATPATPPDYTARALTFLAAAAARWTHVGRDHLIPVLQHNPALVAHGDSAALIALADLDLPVGLLRTLDDQFPDRHVDLDVGIAALTRGRVERQLATTTDPAERGRLHFTLAYREHYAGRDREALPAAEEAVRIWTELAAHDPAHEGRLAAALNLVGVVLSEVGRTAEALECCGRSVDLCRRLVDRDPDEYRFLLAEVLRLRGSHLSDLGRHEEALADGDEAVTLLGQLAQTDPQWEIAYAGALHDLGVHLARCGRHDEAMAPVQQAVDGYYRKFAAQDPATYQPALAKGLSSLAASMLARLDGRGLPFATDAVATFRELAKRNPAYRPELADALGILASLRSTCGDRGQARAIAEETEEAAALHRALAEANPARRPKLATALMNLGQTLSAIGEHDGAVAASEEAVTVYRQVVASHPDGHEQGLANALNNLATRLAEVDRRQDALAALVEAESIHRRRTTPDSERYLALMLPNLAILLAWSGRHAEAVDRAQEAVATLRRLNEFPALFGLALNTLGNALFSAGRPADAAVALREAVEIQRQQTAATDPSFLAQSLRQLGAVLAVTGDNAQALSATEEAVELYHRLAGQESSLAAAWQDLGLFRWRVGQREQALVATERAVGLRRTLAERDPAQRLEFAGALNNLVLFLAEVGRRAEAVGHAREKADVFHRLAEDDPVRYQPSALGKLLGQQAVQNLAGRDTSALLPEIVDSVELDLEAACGLPPARADDLRTILSAAAEVYAEHGHTRIAGEIRHRLAGT